MEKQEIRTFGRRHGKKLSARQQTLIDEVLPTLVPENGDQMFLFLVFPYN